MSQRELEKCWVLFVDPLAVAHSSMRWPAGLAESSYRSHHPPTQVATSLLRYSVYKPSKFPVITSLNLASICWLLFLSVWLYKNRATIVKVV